MRVYVPGKFSHPLPGQQLFNSDMVLYFLKEYFKIQTIPNDLIDWNVRIDYRKLRHLVILDKGETKTANGNFSRLKQIIEEEEIAANLVKGFPVEKLIHTENFLSLLFYFGLLSIKEKVIKNQESVLKIPNETIRRLFYDYIKEGYEETGPGDYGKIEKRSRRTTSHLQYRRKIPEKYGKDPADKTGTDILRFGLGLYRRALNLSKIYNLLMPSATRNLFEKRFLTRRRQKWMVDIIS